MSSISSGTTLTTALVQTADTSGVLQLATNGTTTAVTIDTNQNVGIGCTPLGSAYTGVKTLEIGSQAGHGLIGWNSSNEIDLVSNVYVDSSANYKYANTSAASLYYQSNGGHNWLYAASGTAGNTITFTTGMKLDSSGNFGLGVTPSAWSTGRAMEFGAVGNALWGYSGNIVLSQNTAGYSGSFLYATTAAATRYQQNAGSHLWSNAPSGTAGNAITFTQAMTLDNSGRLLVGQSTVSNSVNGLYFDPAGGGNANIVHASGTASGTGYAFFLYAGSSIGSITQSGTTAVLYNVTSDQRLKENIVDAPEFGSVIDSIKVRSYDWITDQTHQRAGFIAQELVTVAPEAVHQPVNPDDMMAVDYSKLVPMLVKEIQDLRKRLAALEAK
jgi:hypothetical protein